MAFTYAAMTKLAELMNAKGLTDAVLADKVGCDRSMITKLRNGGAVPSLPLALAISAETGVNVADLVPPAKPLVDVTPTEGAAA